MLIRKQVTFSQLNKILETLPIHMEESNEEMLHYYMQKIMQRHFEFGNETAYGYPKLDPKYLERKRKKWGNQPMLVASGLLRESVTSLYKIYKIRGKFRIVLKVPGYAKYVAIIRDFTIINNRDQKDILKFWKKDLSKRRARFVSMTGRRKI